MKTTRNLLALGVLCALTVNSYAGNKLPLDPQSGEAEYHHYFKLNDNFKQDQVFSLIQDWFNAGASNLTAQTGEGPNVNCKNKVAVEEAFNNAHPLQSLDPASGRISGKGLIKYYGGVNSNISLLYMEYYIVLEVKDNVVSATISKMKYHHFNQRTYAARPIFGWQGGRPFDPADKLENLINSPNETREIDEVGEVVNKDINNLFSNLQAYLQTKKALSTQQVASNTTGED